MRLIYFTLLLGFWSQITLRAQEVSSGEEDTPSLPNRYQREIISGPSIGRRCQLLAEGRNQKLSHKHKLDALMFRNRQLYRETPPQRVHLLETLKRNYRDLKYQQRLAILEIQNQQEEAVRKGCFVPFLL